MRSSKFHFLVGERTTNDQLNSDRANPWTFLQDISVAHFRCLASQIVSMKDQNVI